jgi:acyl carrier protein
MTDGQTERIKELVADLLEVDAAEVAGDAGPGNPVEWDSLMSLNLLVALEDEFGVQLAPEDIDQMTTVTAIVEVIRART